jgi:hypothetical protein
MDKKRSDKELLYGLKCILEKHGKCSQNDYDRLTEEGKPGRRTLQRRFNIPWNKIISLAMGEDVLYDNVPEEIEKEEISESRKYLIKQNKQLRNELDKQKHLTQVFVENCLAEIEKLNIKPVKIPRKEFTPDNLEFHALRSDAQVGQNTDPMLVQGLSEYNNEIYEDRVKRWTEKIILFKEQDKRSLGLNKLIIHHLGDQVEGECIYGGQPFYLDLSLTDQLFRSVEVESNAILALATVFNEIEIYAVNGNHGRPGKKGDNHIRTNFDYLFYRTLQLTLKKQENIKFFISESPSMLVQHGDFHFLLNHGDNAKSWAGIPFYGLERMFRRLHDLYSIKIDVELVGHHHQPLNISDRIIMNGSLPGGSELSINSMGLTNEPSQKIFYFSQHFGINRETNLHLADKIILSPDDKGIYTSYV